MLVATTMRGWCALRTYLEMIKFEHSIFALPFAMLGMMWATDGWPGGATIGWIILAMVSCRSAAMAYNRIADREIDAKNPRTAKRAIPAGLIRLGQANLFLFISCALFFLASAMLNRLTLILSPVALGVTLIYSQTKRWTPLCHFVLGLCLGIAPAAAWIGVTGKLAPTALLLVAGVMCWTAGFDIIYSCQDYEFDLREGLFSLPKRFGIGGALWIARALHAAMILCLAALVMSFHLGVLALAGVAAVVLLLLYEHRLVKAHDLSRVDAAFFTVNGYVSVLFFLFFASDIFLLRLGS
jgi:4-hydroxybenzoate polyprenyltransferase